MCAFDLQKSFERARARLAPEPSGRPRRNDAGVSRLPVETLTFIAALLLQPERVAIEEILRRTDEFCRPRGLVAPSRSTLYVLLDTIELPSFRVSELPEFVQRALYNLAPESEVPGAQLVFYCFNYGGLRALCFAAGMPWLFLYRARKMRGWRAKSRNLLLAAARARGI